MKWIRTFLNDPIAAIVPRTHFVQFLPAIASAVGSVGGALLGKQKAPKAADPAFVDPEAETRKALDFNLENIGDMTKLASQAARGDQQTAIDMMEQVLPGFRNISERYTSLVERDLTSMESGALPSEIQDEIFRTTAGNNLATGAAGQAGDFNVARNLGLGALDYQNMLRQRSLQTLSEITGMAPKINPMSTTAMMLTPAMALQAQSQNETARYNAQQSNFNVQADVANNNAGLMASAFQGATGAIGGALGNAFGGSAGSPVSLGGGSFGVPHTGPVVGGSKSRYIPG